MTDLDRAIADLADIRVRLAAGTVFQGFGPAVIAATGVMALGLAAAQTLWPAALADGPLRYFGAWVLLAAAAAALVGWEMRARSRRRHGGLASAMIWSALERFAPAAAAGFGVALALSAAAPEALWLLPGFWQVLAGVGVFAAARSLPGAVPVVGGWYFAAGLASLALASPSFGGGDVDALSPWLMGAPFGAGQLLLAAVLHGATAPGADHG